MAKTKRVWKGRHEFAEWAEPLGIETSRIVTVWKKNRRAIVIYTPDEEHDLAWGARLEQDERGIWQLRGVPKEIGSLAQMMEEFDER